MEANQVKSDLEVSQDYSTELEKLVAEFREECLKLTKENEHLRRTNEILAFIVSTVHIQTEQGLKLIN